MCCEIYHECDCKKETKVEPVDGCECGCNKGKQLKLVWEKPDERD